MDPVFLEATLTVTPRLQHILYMELCLAVEMQDTVYKICSAGSPVGTFVIVLMLVGAHWGPASVNPPTFGHYLHWYLVRSHSLFVLSYLHQTSVPLVMSEYLLW